MTVFGLANIYVKALNAGEEDDERAAAPSPSRPTPRPAEMDRGHECLVVTYALITMDAAGPGSLMTMIPLQLRRASSPPDAISYPPKVVFDPTLEGYVNLFTTRTRQTEEYLASQPAADLVRGDRPQYDMVIAGPSRFGERFMNSVIIGFGSTFLSVFLGTLAAYAFSRFRVPLKDDLLFFILSTRMMPPIAVAIPIFLMFRDAGPVGHPSGHDPAIYGGEHQSRWRSGC